VPDADIDSADSDAVIVDKLRPLDPADYVPELVTLTVPYANQNANQLRPAAADALATMFAAYTDETGLKMQSQSAYRSYAAQKTIYNRYVAQNGQAWADRGSARPGFSEHQTGLALDINALPSNCPIQDCFKNTPQGKWLAVNAWKYGFVLRYPDGYEKVTGYKFEPWHYRFIGVDLAADYHASGAKTLEEFFGLPDAPGYAGA
jgi:D-alanyl-D-alanine carboxypeptidase